jgi:dipeptidyl aminopeptidase/acylaminoacyl peptidase
VHYTCAGAIQAATLFLPPGKGPHPAVVWVHASGPATRLDGTAPLVRELAGSGIAVLSYDKRGTGESEGKCCPGDDGQFNLLAADVAGAVSALRRRPEIDADRIGLLGASQAGWVAPLAAVRSGHVAFLTLVDAPVVAHSVESLYSKLTGEEGGGEAKPPAEIQRKLDEHKPSGVDPAVSLRKLDIPALYLYGSADLSQPTARDVVVLDRLKAQGNEFEYVVYSGANHGLLDVPPSDPRALPAVVAWIDRHTRGAAS